MKSRKSQEPRHPRVRGGSVNLGTARRSALGFQERRRPGGQGLRKAHPCDNPQLGLSRRGGARRDSFCPQHARSSRPFLPAAYGAVPETLHLAAGARPGAPGDREGGMQPGLCDVQLPPGAPDQHQPPGECSRCGWAGRGVRPHTAGPEAAGRIAWTPSVPAPRRRSLVTQVCDCSPNANKSTALALSFRTRDHLGEGGSVAAQTKFVLALGMQDSRDVFSSASWRALGCRPTCPREDAQSPQFLTYPTKGPFHTTILPSFLQIMAFFFN